MSMSVSLWACMPTRCNYQAVVAHQETSEEIDDALDFLLRQVANYHQYLSLFAQEPRVRENTIKIYALIYSYTLRLSIYLKLHHTVRLFKAAFGPFRIKLAKIRQQITQYEQTLIQACSLASETQSRSEHNRLSPSRPLLPLPLNS
ncbi:hypothetical protein BJX65DRAFT_98569 [Aspergillus insuetus]